ncbi:MAG TPA: sialate O-acetylesterase [Polyangia bacterium]|nr:sialate O-acetylesterase [Polyangia bacterium]
MLAVATSCGVEEHPWGKTASIGGGGDPQVTGSGGFMPPVAGQSGSGGGNVGGNAGGTGGVSVSGTGGAAGSGSGTGGTAGGNPVPDGGAGGGGQVVSSGNPDNTPSNKMIAFIHFGHSNMAGRGDSPAADRPLFFTTTPGAWMYHTDKQWQLVQEPYSAGDSTTLQRMAGGPGTAIIKTALKNAAPGYQFVSIGKGNNSAYCSQYLPGAVYYNGMIAGVNALKGKVTFGGVFIMLGITERHGTAADRSGYANCINKLMTNLRTIVGDPNLPLLLTDYEVTATGSLAVGGAVEQAIRPQIMMVPSVVSRSALVPTNNLNLYDDHHFQLDAHRIWVERAIQIMKDKGWFLWGPAP